MVEIETLKSQLQKGIVKFTYKKLNGETREAMGTTNLAVIENYEGPKPKGVKPQNKEVLNYFDTNSNGWRSCRVENIIEVKSYREVKEFQSNLNFN